jgi:tetratricopeptide (TPR) repeat protein
MDVISRRDKVGDSWVRRLISRYEQTHSESVATELIETARLYGKKSSLPAGLAGKDEECEIVDDDFRRDELVLGEAVDIHEKHSRREIARLRRAVADDPDRPFCWSELSRHFLVVGEKKKSARCMHAALKLAKNSVYLKRSAARLFVQTDDVDLSLHLLRSMPNFKSNPWLLAAELATTSLIQRKSKFVDDAHRLLSSGRFPDREVSELAAALGTLELENGSVKRAKSLFKTSLSDPTENSLAQAQWAFERESKIVIPNSAWLTPEPHEASTLASRQCYEWSEALRTCAAWLADEPFSVRAALMGSYLGFRPEHTSVGEQFATAGLRCDSSNFMLLNNRAVARTYQGKIDEAYSDVSMALQCGGAREDAHLIATLGLIAYRSGQPELGRVFYGWSISWFRHLQDRTSILYAILYQLREETRHDRTSIGFATDVAKRIKLSSFALRKPELVGLADLLIQEVSDFDDASSGGMNISVSNNFGRDDLFQQASLFKVPDVAKQRILQVNEYLSFISKP